MTTKKVNAVSAVTTGGSTPANVVTGGSVTPPQAPGSNSGTAVVVPKPGFRELLLEVQQGVEAVIPDGSTIPSSTGGYAKADILTQLGQVLALYTTVDTDKENLQKDLQALHAALPGMHAYYTSLKAAITGFFEPGNLILAKFGFKPKKPRVPLSAVKKAESVVRGQETRKIRGTVSAKARLNGPRFTGSVAAASVVADTPAPAVPAASTVPAPAATPAPAAVVGNKTTSG